MLVLFGEIMHALTPSKKKKPRAPKQAKAVTDERIMAFFTALGYAFQLKDSLISNKSRTILLLCGPPGAGKGTQGPLIARVGSREGLDVLRNHLGYRDSLTHPDPSLGSGNSDTLHRNHDSRGHRRENRM